MGTNICAVCAWRATCQKMFSMSGKDIRCPDYVKDVSIKKETAEEETTNKAEPEKK